MTTTILRKWGNSIGVRIPSKEIEEAGVCVGDKLEIEVDDNGVLILSRAQDPRSGWQEAFNAVAEAEQDEFGVG